MYSIFKNTILKKLKYIIAGFLLITILPGNAGVKNDGRSGVSVPENFLSIITADNDTLEIPDKVTETLAEPVSHYIQNAREISSTGKSINLVLNIK